MIEFTLRQANGSWVLVAPKGHIVYELPASISLREQAYQQARAWLSSWTGMSLRFEDEQDAKRN